VTQRTARDALLFETGPKLGKNTRLGVESELAAPKPGLLFVNLQSTLGMHVSLRESRGGSHIQTWNRYAYVGNNPLAFIDPLGLEDTSTTTCDANGHCTNVTNVDVTDSGGGDWVLNANCLQFAGSPGVGCDHGGWRNIDWIFGSRHNCKTLFDCSLKNTPVAKPGSGVQLEPVATASAVPPTFQYKPSCTGPAVRAALSAAGQDFFPPPNSDLANDVGDKLQDKNVQRATAGTLIVIANYARPIAPFLDVAADWVPVVGQAMFAYQGFSALRAGWNAYKDSIDQCYDRP